MRRFLLFAFIAAALSGCAQKEAGPKAASIETRQNPATVTSDNSLQAFLPQWEQAQSRFINGDPTLWKQNSSQLDDVTILGAFGGYGEKGWTQVGQRYDWASSQYKHSTATMRVEYLNTVASGDLGFTVSIERMEGVRLGDQQNPAQRSLRVTQVFRKENGHWKLVHRHADPLLEKQAPSDQN